MEYKNLGEVCEIVGGGTPSKRREDYYGGDILWTTVGDMQGDYVFETKLQITKLGLDKSSTNIIPVKSVIIATRVGLGKVCILKKDAAINQDLKGIIPKNSSSISNQFLFYWFKSISQKIIEAGTGATVQGVKLSFVKNLQFPNISLPEQKKIVALLDQSFAAINQAKVNIERNIENAKELFQSKLNAIFSQRGEGWEEKTLGEVIDIAHGYAFKSKDFKTNFEGTNPIVLTPGNFSEDSTLYFNEKNTKRFLDVVPTDYKFDIGELVVVMTDLSSHMKILGKPSFIETENVLHNQRIGRVIFKGDELSSIFLYYYFQTNDYLKSIKSTATGTMVRHTAPKRILSNVISFPKSLEHQNNLNENINAIKQETQTINSFYENKIKSLEELKNSILQKAFSGELTGKSAVKSK